MYTVYILKSMKDDKLYIGCTVDLKKRLEQHQKGYVRSTKSRRPMQLVHSEQFADKYEAFRTERSYKTAKGKKILKDKI